MNSMFKKVSLACAVTAASVGMQAAFAAEPAQIINFTVDLTVPSKANVVTVALDTKKADNGSAIKVTPKVTKDGSNNVVNGDATRFLKVTLPVGIKGTKVALMTTTTANASVPLTTVDKVKIPGASTLSIQGKALDVTSKRASVDVMDYVKDQFGKSVPDLTMKWTYKATAADTVDLNGATIGDVAFMVWIVPKLSS